ncbi:MAG: hypothetical protein FJ318_01010 [SAR202 cluster bacterium]|nr:hypothetical protein [SAR202 cluster bacterium]
MTGNQPYLHVATFLPVRRFRDVPAFIRLALASKRQAEAAPGHVASALKASLLKRRFWTVSVWRGRAAMVANTRNAPHSHAVARMADWAGEGACFAEWTDEAATVDWATAMARLKQPSFHYRRGG